MPGGSANKMETRIDMDKICCIILNYNDAATAMGLSLIHIYARIEI